MQTKTIGIISLGLIGGSLFKKLTEANLNIKVVTRNKETIKKVKKTNIADISMARLIVTKKGV